MQTCTRCGLVSPDSSARCECGGTLAAGDSPALVEAEVAGFWIRLLSDFIDALVLGAIGFMISTVFHDWLVVIGERAVLFGAAISFVYAGLLQSHFGKGQTVAKRLLGLRVVRLDGSFLSLDRSLVRWGIMGILVYGGAVATALGSVVPIFNGAATVAALAGAQIALFLGCALLTPFHPLKRGLHDLLTGSIVLRRGASTSSLLAQRHNARRDRVLVIVFVALAVLATVGNLVAARRGSGTFQAGGRVLAALQEMGIRNAGVVDSRATVNGVTHHRIIVTGYVPGSSATREVEDKILDLVRKEMPLDGIEGIVVTLRSGINLGIYRSYSFTNRVESVTPAETAR